MPTCVLTAAAMHRPAHDEAGQGHLHLGVGAETLLDLLSHQLGTGRARILRRQLTGRVGETDAGLFAVQHRQQAPAFRRRQRIEELDGVDRALGDIALDGLVDDTAALAQMHSRGQQHRGGQPGQQHQREPAEQRPRQ